MIGYKQPCRYCEALVEPNDSVCPMCGKVNPAGSLRCPVCRNPTRRQWVNCSNCGISLRLTCPWCEEETFLADYCDHCDARLQVVCPNSKCGAEQAPVSDTCLECGRAMK